jgi:hypothetical protein
MMARGDYPVMFVEIGHELGPWFGKKVHSKGEATIGAKGSPPSVVGAH